MSYWNIKIYNYNKFSASFKSDLCILNHKNKAVKKIVQEIFNVLSSVKFIKSKSRLSNETGIIYTNDANIYVIKSIKRE